MPAELLPGRATATLLLWRALFRLHARSGDRDALIAEEQRLRQSLRDLAEELDIAGGPDANEPDGETVREYQGLLAGLGEREPATAR